MPLAVFVHHLVFPVRFPQCFFGICNLDSALNSAVAIVVDFHFNRSPVYVVIANCGSERGRDPLGGECQQLDNNTRPKS